MQVPYPKAVFFIIVNEFCERFCYYGMRAVLSLYLRDMLLYSESDSKVIYHTFSMLAYFFPLIGAIISDNYLGKFRTILYLSIVYASGNTLLALAAAEAMGLPRIPFSLLGLLLIATGTGGIKPCVTAFGGDQFVVPEQALQLAAFFSMFYFAINAGSLMSTFSTPLLKKRVHCFGENTCYPLAFAVPGVLMITATVIFVAGKPLYKIRKPEGNIMFDVVKCICHGIKQKFISSDKVDHWLDRSQDKYGQKLVNEVKIVLKVLVIFIPLPIYWALHDQQGSGWTFQASRMDGYIGFYTILPDQMQMTNPLMIMIYIPLFRYIFYPGLAKFHLLKTHLQRMVCGGLITAVAFGISAGVSFILEATEPTLPSKGNCQLRIYNPLQCNAILNALPYVSNLQIKPMGYTKLDVDISGKRAVNYSITGCDDVMNVTAGSDFNVEEKKSLVYYMSTAALRGFDDDIGKDIRGLPKIRTLVDQPRNSLDLTYWYFSEAILNVPSYNYSVFTVEPGTYKLDDFDKELSFYLGGVYTILVSLQNNSNTIQKVEYFEITQSNRVNMLWQIPQYILITAGEIMVSITGLEFSYSQAPISMKSVLTAAFLLTTAFGNLIVVIIESTKAFKKQSYNFLLYGGLMILDMILLAYMATKYKYVSHHEENEQENNASDNPTSKKDVPDAQ